LTVTHQIQANGKIYTVVDDFTSVYRAVITGAVTDEILGGPLGNTLSVEVDRPDLNPKVVLNGLFAISAYVEQAFPQLATTSYTVHVTVGAPGFQSQTITIVIPINAPFPVAMGSVALRRKPVTVQGRVVANTVARTPISGAQIIIVDDPAKPPGPPHTVALRSPVKIHHAVGTTAQEITMTVFGGASLTADAFSGSPTLNLSTRAGLAINSILRLANPSETHVEYSVVSSLGPGAGAGQVFLRDPLNGSFPSASTTVDFQNPGAVGTVGALSADADAGDGVVSVSQRWDKTIEIDPGTPTVEYADVGTLTDADGYYTIGGVGRSKELFLEASRSGFTSLTRSCFVAYDNAVNIVDFRL
jgi:hypothetical protein